ncbi:hypothetical protein SAMN05421778_11475 [Sphaerotilus natans]|nr:hypothetical protein [Sphaerotilus natans]SIR68076.1 hypothetical protein SAMN05421778_11475 [Sphaerotilus natans]
MRTTSIILAGLFLAATVGTAHARAGGGVSVGRSSSTVARSMPVPAAPRYVPPRYAPPAPPAPRYNPPLPRTEPSRSGAGSAFVGGLAGAAVGTMVGNALSGPDVVIAPGGGAAAPAAGGAQAAAGTTVIDRPLIGLGGILLLLLAGAGGVYWWSRMRNKVVAQYLGHIPPRPVPTRPDAYSPPLVDVDPVVLFYAVQQAAMDGDRAALERHCNHGMALLLAGCPEPGREATKTLTGLTWVRDDDESILYRFTDSAEQRQVTERWMFDEAGRLDGIEVL